MKAIKLSIVLLLFISFNACSQETSLQKFDFLIGTWKMEGKENYESWKKNDNKLIGEVYKIENGQKSISENIEIILQENQIVYIPTVFDQNEGKGVPFELKLIENKLYSFENSQHDFPKKIQYKILNNNELFISVLGENNKGFSYKLIKQTN